MEITSGNATLAAESSGTGPDVLLVHAGVTDQRSWQHVIDALPGRRCLSYDARGYGRTTYQEQDGWSPVEDAAAVLRAYGAGPAIVVGCSMGGRTTIDLALSHPDLVRALVLIGPAVSGAPEASYEPEILALDEEWEAAEAAGDLDAVNRLEARVWLDGPTAPEGRVGGAARDLFLEMNRIALEAEDPGDEAEGDAWGRVGEIGVPTLILIGEHDLRYVKENCAHLAASIPGARLVELPGVAHVPHVEGDPVTIREITDFVAAH